jgi:NAD-dependent protein deacetylase/lipoamidase
VGGRRTSEMAASRTEGTDELGAAAARLRGARSVLALTGAGVSAESGVPTFRGSGGLWRQFRFEDLATPQAFARDPKLVWEWYAWRRDTIAGLSPNAAHAALAAMERRLPGFHLATQNVDGLHAAAGSRRVLELHGSLWRLRCVGCGQTGEDRRVPLPELPPRCACGQLLRPDVTWFGEMLPQAAVAEAVAAARSAEVVLVIGSSQLVYPAAGLPEIAQARGAFVIEVNTEDTPLTASADAALRGTAADLVPALVPGLA